MFYWEVALLRSVFIGKIFHAICNNHPPMHTHKRTHTHTQAHTHTHTQAHTQTHWISRTHSRTLARTQPHIYIFHLQYSFTPFHFFISDTSYTNHTLYLFQLFLFIPYSPICYLLLKLTLAHTPKLSLFAIYSPLSTTQKTTTILITLSNPYAPQTRLPWLYPQTKYNYC